MRNKSFSIFILFLIFLSPVTSINTNCQCKVLLDNLQGEYNGGCKKGLAHGYGEAKGLDKYKGEFRKGLPNGEGEYIWANGDIFSGSFKKGIKEGYGVLTENGKKQIGYWKFGYYVGSKKTDQAYSVINKKYVTNYSIKRIGEGNKISFKWVKGSKVLYGMEGLNMTANSGVESVEMAFCGYEHVNFPFVCRLNFQNSDKAETMTYDCIFEINVLVPGEYEITFKD